MSNDRLPLTLSLYSANNVASMPHMRTLRFATPVDFSNTEIALDRLQLINSWPNVNAQDGTFSYTWIDGTTYTVQLVAGEWNLPAINSQLQATMAANGHILQPTAQNTAGSPMYFLSIAFSQVLYRTVLTATPLPTTMPSGYQYGTSTTGAPAWQLPSQPKAPQLNIPQPQALLSSYYTIPTVSTPRAPSFSGLIGVPPGTYPSAPSFQTVGLMAPTSLVNTVLVTCDRATPPPTPRAACCTRSTRTPALAPCRTSSRARCSGAHAVVACSQL